MPLDVRQGWCGTPIGAGSLQSSPWPGLATAHVGTMPPGRLDAANPVPSTLKLGRVPVSQCKVGASALLSFTYCVCPVHRVPGDVM